MNSLYCSTLDKGMFTPRVEGGVSTKESDEPGLEVYPYSSHYLALRHPLTPDVNIPYETLFVLRDYLCTLCSYQYYVIIKLIIFKFVEIVFRHVVTQIQSLT